MTGAGGRGGPVRRRPGAGPALLLCAVLAALALGSCASGAASAEEYYSLGMAYFDLGRYEEAAKWFDRARGADRTRNASEYALGRIAFARGDYEKALGHFEKILRKDPRNIPALKASAFTLIRLERLPEAELRYGRVLELVPESADDGYSYAVVLLALEKPAEAEAVLERYAASLDGNRDALLLLARARRGQGKAEAIDDYRIWLAGGEDPRVRLEYARSLEGGEFYARALEEYRALLQAAPSGPGGPGGRELSRPWLRFAIGGLLLVADGGGGGMEELEGAVADGFTDRAAMEALLDRPGVPDPRKEEIRRLLGTMRDE